MSRSIATLAWLDTHDDEIRAHPGAAFPERELLRLILDGASGTGGVMSAAYRAQLAIKVPSLLEREDARGYAHEVMFGSDFGLDPITVPAQVGPLIAESSAIHAADTDTLGELLIAALLIGEPLDDTAFTLAWDAIPRIFENYHVILVGGIYFALMGD
jgi:hypothetical protein